jgi:hypothetical protein
MNKRVAFSFTLLFTLVLISFVSADIGDSVSRILNDVNGIIEPVANFAFGSSRSESGTFDDLMVKVLIFIVMLCILYLALERMPFMGNNEAITWTVASVIAILSVRLLSSPALLNFVWLPSGVLGVALVCLFPLVIYFFFIESFDNRIIRKLGWIFFAVLFFALAAVRWNQLYDSKLPWNLGWIYIGTAVLGLLTLSFDGTIRRAWKVAQYENKRALHESKLRTFLMRERADLEDSRVRGLIDNYAAQDAALREKEKRYGLR